MLLRLFAHGPPAGKAFDRVNAVQAAQAVNSRASRCKQQRIKTAEAKWLERTRRFATHAIGQWENALVNYGRGRFSLWARDAGLVVYLSHCINSVRGLPGLGALG